MRQRLGEYPVVVEVQRDHFGQVEVLGGPGTLAEVSTMWNHLLTNAISARPLILIGPGWKTTFETYFSVLGENVSESERVWLSFAGDVDSACDLLQSFQTKT